MRNILSQSLINELDELDLHLYFMVTCTTMKYLNS